MKLEEGYKIWRGIDSSFHNWHKEFDKIWREHSKISKSFLLMGSFWAKHILFELKQVYYTGVILHEIEKGYKICSKIDLLFQNRHKEFHEIWHERSKVSKKFHFNGLLLSKVYIVWAKKVRRISLNWRWIKNLERNGLGVSNWLKKFDKIWPEHS